MAKYKFDNQQQILDFALQIAESKVQRYSVNVTTNELARKRVAEMLKLVLNDEREHFGVVFLNNQNQFIAHEILFSGTIDSANVHPREVVKSALKHNAAAVIFGHNHPSGMVNPSEGDKQITKRLIEALQMVDIRVLDHIIVGGDASCSFYERGLI
jgi:DNA repair protein RadC